MYYGFKNERPKRTDVIHDKGQFLNQIMQQAEIFDKGKLEWKWLIADNPTDIVLLIRDLDMNRVMKCVKWALQSKKDELSKFFIHDEFTIRFIDGFHYNAKSYRYPTDQEKRKKLCDLMKGYLIFPYHLITTQQYRSEKGKMRKSGIESTLSFIRNLTWYHTNNDKLKRIRDCLNEYQEYTSTRIMYEDVRILYHIENPVILGEIDVKIECDGNKPILF